MPKLTPRRIPKGNTLAVRWRVNANGQASLEGLDLQLVLIDPKEFPHTMDFTVNGNVITFVYQGYLQKHTGIYMLELYERRGLLGQARLDKAAFELVKHTHQATPLDADNLELTPSIDLEDSELAILAGSPYIQNGYWYIDGRNLGVQAEGKTPHIVEGYWYIGDEPTGQPAFLIPTFDPTTGKIRYEI